MRQDQLRPTVNGADGKIDVKDATLEMGNGDKIVTGLIEASQGDLSISADSNTTLTGGVDMVIGAGGKDGGQIGNTLLDANGNIVITAGTVNLSLIHI